MPVPKTPYFLLEEVQYLDDGLFHSLLGLAVRDASRPITGDHAPSTTADAATGDPPVKALDANQDLYIQQTQIHNVKFMEEKAKTKEGKMKFDRILKGIAKSEIAKGTSLETAVFRRVSIRNASQTIANLLKEDQEVEKPAAKPNTPEDAGGTVAEMLRNGGRSLMNTLGFGGKAPEPTEQEKIQKRWDTEMARRKYRDQVLDLLKANEKGLKIVISFITCVDMDKETRANKSRAGEFAAGAPVKEVTGVPVDIQASAAMSSSANVESSGTYEGGEYLIACSYLPLKSVEKSSSRLDKLLSRSKHDDFIVGEEGEYVWTLGKDPTEGDYAAPMGRDDKGGEDEECKSTCTDDNEDASSTFELLHVDDSGSDDEGHHARQ